MRQVLTVARNTYRENIRDRVLYNLILFALIMILSSLALGQLTLGNNDKVILDLGLSSISIFGMLISIFIGIGLVYKELEKRTVYALLAKPIHRHEFILGKYLGLLFTLFVNLVIMTVGLELALLYTGRIGLGGYLRVLPAVYLVFLSLALVTAPVYFFSLGHRTFRQRSAEFRRAHKIGPNKMALPDLILCDSQSLQFCNNR
jgi:ABC-type transport system involved in multi-copper enzyme maturation permease subunit